MTEDKSELMIPMPLPLLRRLSECFVEMGEQNAHPKDRRTPNDLHLFVGRSLLKAAGDKSAYTPLALIEVPTPLTLLQRVCSAFLEMVDQGARTQDQRLMVDVEQAVADFDQGRP